MKTIIPLLAIVNMGGVIHVWNQWDATTLCGLFINPDNLTEEPDRIHHPQCYTCGNHLDDILR